MRRPTVFQTFISTVRPLEWAYFGAIALAVIPFGSVYPMLIGLSCITFGTLAILSCFLRVNDRRLERFIAWLTLCVVLLVCWCLVQTIPLSTDSLAHPIWAQISSTFGPVGGTISVNPGATMEGLLSLLAPCLAAFAALRIFSADPAALRLWRFLARFGAILIFVTLVQHITLPGTLLIYEKWAYQTDFTTTFVNRNTAATFIGVALLLNIGLVVLQSEDLRFDRWFKRTLALDFKIHDRYGAVAVQLLICFLIFISLFLTRSRAGTGCTFLAVLVFGFMILRSRRSMFAFRHKLALFSAGVVFFIAIFGLFWLFGGLAIERLSEDGFEDTGRLCTYISLIGAFQDHWLVGTGFGAFADTFPAYRDPACTGIVGVWDRAHDSYLEFVLGVGVMGIGVIAAIFWLLGSTFWGGLKSRRRMRFAPMASISIFVLIAMHALVDFSVQIPGFGIFVSSVLSSGVVLSMGRSNQAA